MNSRKPRPRRFGGFADDRAARQLPGDRLRLSWQKLPSISGISMGGILPEDLHESYGPVMPIERLGLAVGVQRILAGRQVASLGQLLLTPGPRLTAEQQPQSPLLFEIQSQSRPS